MTLKEIEEKLPNGLHDAQLLSIMVNLKCSTLTLDLEVDGSSPGAVNPGSDSLAVKITVDGLCYLQLDPPDILNPYAIGNAALIEAGDDPVQKGLVDAEVAAKLPAGSFLHWLYLNGWNSSIVIGGRDARIEASSEIGLAL